MKQSAYKIVFSCLVISLLSTAINNPAAASGGEAATSNDNVSDDDGLPIVVQMSPMLVDVAMKNGEKTKTTVTPYFVGYSLKALSYLCRRAPKAREALFVAFGRDPVRNTGPNKIDDAHAAKVAMSAVNQALGKKAIKRAYILVGSKPVSEGVASRLPGSSRGCQRLTQLPKEIEAKEAREAAWEERRLRREEERQQREDLRKHRILQPLKKD